MQEFKSKMESSLNSNNTVQSQLNETQNLLRALENDKQHVTSKLLSKERQVEDLEEEIRKLKRKMEVC